MADQPEQCPSPDRSPSVSSVAGSSKFVACSSKFTVPNGRSSQSLSGFVVSGLCVAIIGATALALVECLAATYVTARHFDGSPWPWGLLTAALGKLAVTHTLFWCPLMLVVGGIYWVRVRRKPPRCPEPLMLAIWVALAGIIVIPADLGIAGKTSKVPLVAGYVLGPLLAVGVYAVTRRVCGAPRRARFRRVLGVATVLAALVTVVSGVVFARSPLCAPGAYRVPGSTIAHVWRDRPNVVWIVLDTVRPDHMSCYGYPAETTPFLERWAAQSIVFDRASANGIWTVPSHASMFTGLSLREHGADHEHLWLDEEFPTVAEALAGRGYATAIFSNNPWVSPKSNLTKGFETRSVIYHLRHLSRFSLEYLGERCGVTPWLPWCDGDFGAAITNTLAGQWLDTQAQRDAPFFMFINYMEAHLPYRVPRSYRGQFMTPAEVDRSYDLRFKVYGEIVSTLDRRFSIEGGEFLEASDREILKRQYDAAICYLDDRVREVMDMLAQRRLLNNTLVVVVSDHGEYLDTHAMWGHHMQIYDDTTRVELIIRRPGGKQGQRVSVPVLLSDLYTTVLGAALGGPVTAPGAGSRDLFELAARGPTSRMVISEYGGPCHALRQSICARNDPMVTHRAQPQLAVWDGNYKYIASADGQGELYNLGRDPGELNNVVDIQSNEADRLAAHLQQWLDAVSQYQRAQRATIPAIDPATLKALRSLGYVGGKEQP